MNRAKYFNFIESKLSLLATRIEMRGGLNILDLHLHSENFYLHFFKVLFGWELENRNAVDPNAAGVDLLDTTNKIIVQVSATATKQKIESALAKDLSTYKGYSFKFISISNEDLERLIVELNAKHHTKGEYENTLRQLNTVESKLTELNEKLAVIDNELFSDEFALKIKEQVDKFNRHFSSVSYELYGEKYALKPDTKTVKGRRIYEFTPFDLNNFSSGKKQGEISCFDIAYTLFADEESIPCMHFLLNDKKELMHDNQLLSIANFVNAKGIQFVASILKDKLPEELNKDEYVVVKLSQKDKLFRIERGMDG